MVKLILIHVTVSHFTSRHLRQKVIVSLSRSQALHWLALHARARKTAASVQPTADCLDVEFFAVHTSCV